MQFRFLKKFQNGDALLVNFLVFDYLQKFIVSHSETALSFDIFCLLFYYGLIKFVVNWKASMGFVVDKNNGQK